MDLKNNLYCYVVEGKTDIDKIKKCGARFVLQTNGKYFPPNLINNLKEISKHRLIIILTDPDPTGIEIRKRLKEELKDSCIYIKTSLKLSHDNKKIGIAQIKLNNLKEILNDYITHDNNSIEEIKLTRDVLLKLNVIGVNSRTNKNKIENYFNIKSTNSKELLSLLQMLGLSEEDLKGILKQ